MTLVLYHRTTIQRANAVLQNGFRDGQGRYMTDQEWSGVWLSLQPLDSNEGAWGDALIQVTLDCAESEIAEYEWVEYAADDEAMTEPLAKSGVADPCRFHQCTSGL